MGQEEILELLEKSEKPISRKQICDFLNYDGSKASHLIKKLLNSGDIKFFEINNVEAKKMFGDDAPRRRMKLYYTESNERIVKR